MATTTIRIAEHILEEIDRLSNQKNLSRNSLIEHVLSLYVTQQSTPIAYVQVHVDAYGWECAECHEPGIRSVAGDLSAVRVFAGLLPNGMLENIFICEDCMLDHQ